MLIPFNEQSEYLLKIRPKTLVISDNREIYNLEKKRTKEFVNSFNEESKKQKQSWYAKTEEYKSSINKKPFILTYLCKKIIYGWWIFKVTNIVKLHIVVYESHVSFVGNDYVIVNSDIEDNNKIFYYLPELKPILDRIPQAFFILPKGEIFNFEKEVSEIKVKIKLLKDKSDEI